MTLTLLPVMKERKVQKPYVLLAALQCLDVLTTWFLLNWVLALSEGNPIADELFQHAGLNVGLVILLLFKLAVVWLFWMCQTKVRFAAAIYGLVVVNNLILVGAWFFGYVR